MASRSDRPVERGGDGMTVERIEAFLRDHPDLLARHPALIEGLAPPERRLGDNVADMQAYMIARLRAERGDVRDAQARLVERARRERRLRDRVHAATLALIDARDLRHLVELATSDLAILLDADIVALAVETCRRDSAAGVSCGVRCLPKGTVPALMEDDRPVVLRSPAHADARVFASGAALVASEALIRIGGEGGLPRSVLAMGSRRPDRFRPGDPVDMFRFLGSALDRCLRRTLGAPS